jgi:transcriptional regulator with XRE-family HTH domain
MGLRIKELREQRGWTQEHLAALARMSRSQLAMIERETRPANTVRLNAIASALGVPTEQLFQSAEPDAQLLALLRRLPKSDREALVRLAESLAAKAEG